MYLHTMLSEKSYITLAFNTLCPTQHYMPHNMKQKIASYLHVTTVLGFYGDSKRYRCVPTHNTIREALPAFVHSVHTLNTTQIQHDKFPVTLLLCWVGSYGDSKRYRCVPAHNTIREVSSALMLNTGSYIQYHTHKTANCRLSNHCAGFLR